MAASEQVKETIKVNVVSYLREFILESYATGFAIFQELVQNANDANSSKLVIDLVTEGIPTANNSLLKNPFVLVSNDGPFRPEDEKAIFNIGIGSKKGDDKKIGKYGLGMKSLFHWADVLIFFTKDKFGILNPFSETDEGESEHSSWNGDDVKRDEDLESLKKMVRERQHFDNDDYFSLFIPIRRNNGLDHIINSYYKADSIIELLNTKEDKTGTKEEFINAFLEVIATIHFTSKSHNRLTSVQLISNKENIEASFKDDRTIELTDLNSEAPILVKCYNHKIQKDGDVYKDICKKSSVWPIEKIVNPFTLEKTEVDVLDARDNAFIVLQKKENNPGNSKLKLMWSVYLPLKDEEQFYTVDIGGNYSYTIIINSSFSIDSGRNRMDGFKNIRAGKKLDLSEAGISNLSVEAEMEALWNNIIFRKILMPEFTQMLMNIRKEFNIRSKDEYNSLISAFDRRTDSSFYMNAASESKIILFEDDKDHNLDWKLSLPEKGLLVLPVPDDSLLVKKSFQDILGYLHTQGPLCFESQDRRSFISRECRKTICRSGDDLDRVLSGLFKELLKDEYSDLYVIPDFSKFIALIIEKYQGASVLASFRMLLRRILYVHACEHKTLPLVFRRQLVPTAYAYCNLQAEKTYFVYSDNAKSDLYIKGNNIGDNRFIVLPKSQTFDFKAEIDYELNPVGYLRYVALEFMPLLPEYLDHVVFEELVEEPFKRTKTLQLKMPELINHEFSDSSIIPITRFSSLKKEQLYLSFNELETLYSYPDVKGISLLDALYDYIPDVSPIDCISSDNLTLYGLSNYQNVHTFSIKEILLDNKDRLLDARPDRIKAENFLKRLLDSLHENFESILDLSIPLFPTTDGLLSSLSHEDPHRVMLDLDGVFYEFRAKDSSFQIVYLSNNDLKDTMRKYEMFREYRISPSDALQYYLKYQNPSDYDSDEIISMLSNTKVTGIAHDILMHTPWLYYGGRKYSGNQIIAPDVFDTTTEAIFSQQCLILDKEQLNEISFKNLYKNYLCITSIDELPEEIIESVFYGCSSLDLCRCPAHILPVIISAMIRLPESDILHSYGCYLKNVMDSNDSVLSSYLVVKNDNNSTSLIKQQWSGVLYELSEMSRDRNQDKKVLKEAFIYLINQMSYDNVGEFRTYCNGKIMFPSKNAGDWNTIDNLCDPNIWHNIEGRFLLASEIKVCISYSEDESNNKNIAKVGTSSQYPAAGYKDLRKAWPQAEQTLIAMLLFVCRKLDEYPYIINLVGGESVFFDHLTKYRDHIGNEFLALSKEQVFSRQKLNVIVPHVVLTLHSRDVMEVTSITGKTISANVRLDPSANQIFVSDRNLKNARCERVYFVLPALSLSATRINELIINLIQHILTRVYGQTGYNNQAIDFREDLRALVLSNKQDRLKVTQDQIMREIYYTLGSLKISKSEMDAQEVKALLSEIDRCKTDFSRAKVIENDYNKQRNVNEKLEKLCSRIIEKITDTSVAGEKLRSLLLKKIRAYLGNNQYSSRSILFELFQNADDAAMQLKVTDSDSKDKTFFFRAGFDDTSLHVKHNGRVINLNPYDSNHEEWKQDLRNMLRFNNSNKNEDPEMKETGTYGLGFKSCYFITDTPCIYSGMSISAKVLGGIYPCDDYSVNPDFESDETMFVLPYRSGLDRYEVEKNVVNPFRKSLDGLMLFSKCISQFYICGETYSNTDYRAITDHVRLYTLGSNCYLKLSWADGDIVFALSSKGVKETSNDLDSFWKTQPLQKLRGPRYMINSDNFVVDTGRNTLCDNEDNKKVLKSIGTSLGRFLYDVFNERITIISGVSGKDICSQILNLISDGVQAEDREFSYIVFSSAYSSFISAAGYFFTGYKYMPSSDEAARYYIVNKCCGLDVDTGDFVSFISNYLEKSSNESVSIFKKSALIPLFVKKSEIREIDTLEKLYHYSGIDRGISVSAISLVQTLGDFIEAHHGQFSWNIFKYQNEEGNYRELKDLVHPEKYLESIAPRSYQLKKGYPENIQGSMYCTDSILARWIEDLYDENSRIDALYLISRKKEILESLSLECWVFSDIEQYLDKIPDYFTRTIIRSFIDEAIQERVPHTETCSDTIFGGTSIDIVEVYEKWDALSEKERDRMIRSLRYKMFGKEVLDLEDPDTGDWMRLLCLASLRILGRTTNAQNITFTENFLKDMKILGDPIKNSKIWISHMIYYPVSKNPDGNGYEYWRQMLPTFAQFVICCDDFYNCLRFGYDFNPNDLLDLKDNPLVDEYDYNLPNMKVSLGHFFGIVGRELLASGIDMEDRHSLEHDCIYLDKSRRELCGISDDMKWMDYYEFLVEAGVSEEMLAKYYDYPLYCYYGFMSKAHLK